MKLIKEKMLNIFAKLLYQKFAKFGDYAVNSGDVQ